MKLLFLPAILIAVLATSMPTASAYPYCGGWGGGYSHGGWGGCYRGGWYGTGIPNGLGWSLFGLGAAAAVAAPVAYATTAPVYYAPAPVYYSPAPSVGYYNPPQTVVVDQSSQRVVRREPVQSAPTNPTLVKVQSRLSALGYYKGGIDGSFGPQTEQAVSNFQAENGLSVTGRIDLKTLSSLGITL
jgi:hypothetical protein